MPTILSFRTFPVSSSKTSYPVLLTASSNFFLSTILGSNSMYAFSEARLILALDTPLTFFNAFSILETHDAQCIPPITNFNFSILPRPSFMEITYFYLFK